MARFHYPPVDARLQRGGCYLTSVGALSYRRGQAYPVEGHRKGFAFEWERGRTIADFAMVMIVEGMGEWESPRGQREKVAAGDLLYLAPGRWHRYRPLAATGWREKWCCLSGSVVHGMVTSGWLPGECRRVSGWLSAAAEQRLDRLREDVLENPGTNHPAWGLRALAVLLECLAEVRQGSGEGHEDAVVGTAMEFIGKNLHRPLGVNDIASFCGVERRTLERRFAAADLGPVGRCLIVARIMRAESLLRDTALPVKEIAYACGFGSAGRMIYDFRSHRGTTPGRLRKK